ncbi:thiamine-phosphate kinase [Blastopirellula marina]|uniref:Thiamine-monophosphate kinase n=1 Tax=Blastopirellula marina TaxID=124 RepID=A0A2S8GLE5_9BACT|nr:thiamine-phosphate kinase [Blastopirellula marina]PQO45256.1 thiamine-monophosphate kinase [Blastopirellula marina]
MEQAFLKYLAQQKQTLPTETLGIGDDAAVLSWPAETKLVVCTDLISDETDFHLADVTPQQIGRKALAINISDIAAMACQPVGALLTLLLPKGDVSLPLAQGIYEGAAQLGEQFGCPIIGGDTNTWPGKVAVSVTVFGRCPAEKPLLRKGAQPGDAIFVTGQLGGSILGHHIDFTPRVHEALQLRQICGLSAGMDLSDGLSIDLPRLCEQSRVGAEIESRPLPVSPAAIQMAAGTGKTPQWHALNDGEDFELLFTVPAGEVERLEREWSGPVPITRIGTILADPGVWLVNEKGSREPLQPEGFSHQ